MRAQREDIDGHNVLGNRTRFTHSLLRADYPEYLTNYNGNWNPTGDNTDRFYFNLDNVKWALTHPLERTISYAYVWAHTTLQHEAEEYNWSTFRDSKDFSGLKKFLELLVHSTETPYGD